MDFSNIIAKNKSNLVKATNCNDALLDILVEEGILHQAEVSDLQAKTSEYARASYLWDLLKQKQVTKEALIKIFKDLNQGAAHVLTTLVSENPGVINEAKIGNALNIAPKASTSDGKVKLHFNDDIKHDVFKKLKPRLLEEMVTSSTNSVIIEELNSLPVFDDLELDPIREGKFESERSCMTQLLTLIGKKSPKDILCCLETLCNLKQIPIKSKKFRDIIEDVYPESSLGQ